MVKKTYADKQAEFRELKKGKKDEVETILGAYGETIKVLAERVKNR